MKMSTQVAIFFIAFNALAGIMGATGVSDDLGLNTETGVDDLQQTNTNISIDNTAEENLKAIRREVTEKASGVFNAVLPGMKMLKIWVPDLWVNYLLTPLGTFFVAKDIAAFLRGTDL